MNDPLRIVKDVLDRLTEAERTELRAHLAPPPETPPDAARRRLRQEYRRCYGRRCRTCDAGGRHGPYIYEVWRDGDTVRRRYVRKGVELPAPP